jgi:hypothetical protein
MKSIRFTATRVVPKEKRGILVPDVNGYVKTVVGALNAFNSAGEYYTAQGAEDLFRNSSILLRRMGKGYLKSELGHPKRLPGQSDDEYLERILSIEETNVSAHIKELELDYDFGRRNPQYGNQDMVAIIATLRPSGPHGKALEASLANPDENVGFSIRALTHNYYERGQTYRVLTTVVTFDQVTEQGIPIANKWASPALESIDTLSISNRQLQRLVERNTLVATESDREMAMETLKASQAQPARLVELPRLPLHARW